MNVIDAIISDKRKMCTPIKTADHKMHKHDWSFGKEMGNFKQSRIYQLMTLVSKFLTSFPFSKGH